jgi:hypothetical protein
MLQRKSVPAAAWSSDGIRESVLLPCPHQDAMPAPIPAYCIDWTWLAITEACPRS